MYPHFLGVFGRRFLAACFRAWYHNVGYFIKIGQNHP